MPRGCPAQALLCVGMTAVMVEGDNSPTQEGCVLKRSVAAEARVGIAPTVHRWQAHEKALSTTETHLLAEEGLVTAPQPDGVRR